MKCYYCARDMADYLCYICENQNELYYVATYNSHAVISAIINGKRYWSNFFYTGKHNRTEIATDDYRLYTINEEVFTPANFKKKLLTYLSFL